MPNKDLTDNQKPVLISGNFFSVQYNSTAL